MYLDIFLGKLKKEPLYFIGKKHGTILGHQYQNHPINGSSHELFMIDSQLHTASPSPASAAWQQPPVAPPRPPPFGLAPCWRPPVQRPRPRRSRQPRRLRWPRPVANGRVKYRIHLGFTIRNGKKNGIYYGLL